MNLRAISRNVGVALLVSALFMLLSLIVSLIKGDSASAALSISFAITFIVGVFPFIFVRSAPKITLKDGYIIIVFSWILSFIFGMLPYALWGGPFTLVNAWFESVSGFTTTGATILEDVEALPASLLLWRSSTHFIGGLGVVVFLLLIIPSSSPVRLRLSNMELSALSRDGYSSRANKTVYIFTSVYFGIFVLSFISYMIAGMSPFDALNHAFSVSATGGFSTKNLSIGHFDSVAIDLITIFFMIASSVHFGLIFMSLATRSIRPLRNPVVRLYLGGLLVASIITSVSLKVEGIYDNWSRAFLDGSFQVVSYASTSGFAIADNSTWPLIPCFILLTVSLICGCAGSTTGGLKVDRILILLKAIWMQIKKTLSPSTMFELRLGRRVLHDEDIYPHVLYISMYILLVVVSMIIGLFTADVGGHAVTGSIAALGNVGPSIGEIGSLGNYNAETVTMKLLFAFDMFLGRVEIYPVFAVIAMIFRRK